MADVAFGSVLSGAKSSQQAGLTSTAANVAHRANTWILRYAQDDNTVFRGTA